MFWKKLPILLLVFSLLITLSGCGGSAGVSSAGIGSGGTITGRVLANASGGSVGYAPLANVYVAAKRESDGITRTAYTDANGYYRFTGLPLGTWRFGFQAHGYTNIPVDSSTIVGYSEAGRSYQIYDTYLNGYGSSGDGNVVVSLRDAVTGQAIVGATVMVGPASGVTGFNGEVTLSVPVRIDQSTGQPMAERVIVSAAGVDGSTVSPSYITPFAFQTTYQTVFVSSLGSGVGGHIQASTYNTYYAGSGAFGTISITSPQIPSYYLNPVIDSFNGTFTCNVPVGTNSFDLYFTSPYFESRVVGPITPTAGGGVQQLSSPVVLTPKRRDVFGYVASGNGSTVISGSVVIVELGQGTNVTSGQFYFPSVPVGMTLTFSASLSVTTFPYTETGQTLRTITTDGAGPFSLGTIITN